MALTRAERAAVHAALEKLMDRYGVSRESIDRMTKGGGPDERQAAFRRARQPQPQRDRRLENLVRRDLARPDSEIREAITPTHTETGEKLRTPEAFRNAVREGSHEKRKMRDER